MNKLVEAKKVDQQPRNPVDRRQLKKPHRRRIPLRLYRGLAGLGAISAMLGAILATSFDSKPLQQHTLSPQDAAVFDRGDKEAFGRNLLQIPEIDRPVNILLLGIKTNLSDLKHSDRNQRKKIGYDAEIDSLDGLSDTMMLLRFDPQAGQMVVFGIPRDTKIERAGYGIEKINAVDHESGPAAAAQEVSKVLQGVPIDRYIRLNNMGLEKLIDALGGLTLTVPKDIKYQDDSQHFYVNLKAGKQHLDGHNLLGFLRFRHDAYGDIGRMQRQQLAIQAVMEQWVNPVNIARIPQLFSILQSHVDTNLTVEEILAVGGFSLHTGKSKLQMLMMPGDYNGDGKHSVSYWLPNDKGIQNMMARYFDRGTIDFQPVKAENIRINIQDTTYYPDATARSIDKLHQAGYQNVHLDQTLKLKENLPTTQIIAQTGDPRLAEGIAQALGCGEVKIATSGHLYSQVTIAVGRDCLH